MARIEFDPDKCQGQEAIVVSFDICEFSKFCSHADAYRILNKFLSTFFDELECFFQKAASLPGWTRHLPPQEIPSPSSLGKTT